MVSFFSKTISCDRCLLFANNNSNYTLTHNMASVLTFEDDQSPLSSLDSVSEEVDVASNISRTEEEQFQVEVPSPASAATSSHSTHSSKWERAPSWVWAHFWKYSDKKATHVHCLLCQEDICYIWTRSTGVLEHHVKKNSLIY
jgi:hypothetical protein